MNLLDMADIFVNYVVNNLWAMSLVAVIFAIWIIIMDTLFLHTSLVFRAFCTSIIIMVYFATFDLSIPIYTAIVENTIRWFPWLLFGAVLNIGLIIMDVVSDYRDKNNKHIEEVKNIGG